MVAVGIDSMKEVVIGISEMLGNGWQVISTVCTRFRRVLVKPERNQLVHFSAAFDAAEREKNQRRLRARCCWARAVV